LEWMAYFHLPVTVRSSTQPSISYPFSLAR
jgi:hypothetical protein